MSQQGNFVVFCAEQYKMARDMSGRDLAELFTRIFGKCIANRHTMR